MGIFSWIFGKKPIREKRYGRFEEADFPKLQEGLQKKIGRLQAERVLDEQKIQNLKTEIKNRDDKILSLSMEKVVYSPFTKRNSISLFDLLNFSRKKKQIRVMTRDHQYVGRLIDMRMSSLGNTYVYDIITDVKDKKGKREQKLIMRHDNFSEMFHNPLGFINAIKNGVIVINRLSSGQFVPDLIYDDGRNIDEIVGELQDRQSELQDIASRTTERADSERHERYLEKLGQESTKKLANSSITALVESTESAAEAFKQLGKDRIDNIANQTKLDLLEKNSKMLNQSLDTMMGKFKKGLTQEEHEKFREEMKTDLEMFSRQVQEMVKIATPKNIVLMQKKPKEPELKKETIIGRTLHPLRKRGEAK